MDILDNLSTKKKEELSEKLQINKSTLYRYKTTKPYLYELINLGLQKEKELEKMEEIGIENPENAIIEIMSKVNTLTKEIKEIKEKI